MRHSTAPHLLTAAAVGLLSLTVAGCSLGDSSALGAMAMNCGFDVDHPVQVERQAKGDGGFHNDYGAVAFGVQADRIHLPKETPLVRLTADQCSRVEFAARGAGIPSTCAAMFPSGRAYRVHNPSRACYISEAVDARVTIASAGTAEP